MIIRIVAVVSLTSLLVMVLYLPAAHPPQRFINQVRIENEMNSAFWGSDAALRILARMLDLHARWQQTSPLPQTFTNAQAPSQINAALAEQTTQMVSRLTNIQYFESLDALMALATYRYAAFAEWFPSLLAFIVAAVFDGAMCRLVKSKEFLQHNPERYALAVSAVIVIACGTVIAFVIPMTLHPVFLAVVPLGIGIFAGLAVTNFHHRG